MIEIIFYTLLVSFLVSAFVIAFHVMAFIAGVYCAKFTWDLFKDEKKESK